MYNNIVISGISGRYPDCQNIKEFADALFRGVDLITVDNRRFPVGVLNTPEGAGKIAEIDKFDAAYFGIHPKQAEYIDPRHRILLETIYECIIDAGFNPKELRGSKTGVYVAIASFTNWESLKDKKTDGYSAIGVHLSHAANRASYCFDFKGPSYVLEAACSGSVYALVNAIKDLKLGLADYAVVCGAQMNLHPHETSEFSKLNMMSTDSKCRAFSALRDGYARSEAAVSIFLQREKGSRRIYATVLGGVANADGYKLEGITFPSSETQLQLLKEVYAEDGNGGINPNDIVYLEAHGTGTVVGDIQELRAVEDMFCKNRENPLLVGSVKSNMGHGEVSSGLCSISKVIVAMEYGIIPANLHTNPVDMELPGIKAGKIKIATENIPWDKGLVAINSFGFGGANAHVVLKSNPKEKTKEFKPLKHRLVQASGRTREAVYNFLDGVEENQDDTEFLALVDEIHKINVEGHYFRGYTILGDKPKREVDRYTPGRPIWFIYTGMGSQWVGMGRDLMRIEVFRDTIKRCAATLTPYNINLLDIITSTDPKIFDRITNSFTAIGAMEVALTDVLYSLGIVPDNFAGHSMGEVGCAYADGQITPEQAVLLAFARGYVSENVKLPVGQMAVVGLPKEECQSLLPDDIYIACQNGKGSVTVAGPLESTIHFVEKLSSQGIFAKKVNTNGFAYHSKYIRDATPLLYDFIKKVLGAPKLRSPKWISTSVPEGGNDETWTQYNCAEYHANNFANTVLFDQVYSYIPDNAIVIEVAPHGLMQAILKRELGPNVTNIPLRNRDSDDNDQFLLSAIGKIFVAGGQPNLRNFYKGITFPVSRGTKMLSPLVQWDHSVSWYVPYWQYQDSFGRRVTINLSDENYSYLKGYSIDGRVLMPATGYLELVWQVLADLYMKSIENFPVTIENVKIERTLTLLTDKDVTFLINIMKQSGNFEIVEGGSVVVSGKIRTPQDITIEFTNPESPMTNSHSLLKKDIYKEFRLRGYMYNSSFKGIKKCDVHGLQGIIEWKRTFTSFLDSMLHLNIIADTERALHLPKSIEKVIIDPIAHLKQVSEHQNELPISYNPLLNTVKSGAIEIIDMESSTVPHQQHIQEDPILETYEFVPYKNATKSESLKSALQIILQNTGGIIKRPKICVVSQEYNPNLSCQIKKILDKIAMSEAELVEYNPENYNNNNFDAIVIDEHVADDNKLETVLENLSQNGFVLYLGDYAKVKTADLQIVYQAVNDEENVYLLRPTNLFPSSYTVVEVKNNDFEWLNNVKELVESKSKKVIYLFSQGEETSGIIGLVKCLMAESIAVKLIFIEDSDARTFSVDDEFYREQLKKDLTINVLKENRWGTYVHLLLNPVESKDMKDAVVKVLTSGEQSTLKWVETSPDYIKYHPNSELVYVFYSTISLKNDLLTTKKQQLPQADLFTWADTTLSFEYAGITDDGRRVMGISPYECLSLQVKTDPVFTWEVPDEWSLEEAATVPCAYAMCYYALIERGQMQPGESVLIHTENESIGLAAISIALSDSKNGSLKRMIKQNTNRRGIDVVLNALSAELFQESLKCVAMRGRFLEIGNIDIFNGTPIDSKLVFKSCNFQAIVLHDLFSCSSKIKYRIKNIIDEGIKNGAVKPLPRTVVDETKIENAFRYLAFGNHRDKVLIKLRKEYPLILQSPVRTVSAIPKVYFDRKKSYILVGGLGGFGLELADWMIGKGATKIVLNSRRGISNGYQAYCLRKWSQFKEVTVKISKEDSSNLEGASELVGTAQELGPVGGIFNMALVLRDALIENQTEEMYEEVFKSKVFSGQNMDKITRNMCPQLDHFVAFSSVCSGKGHSGVSNYGMANSVLEKICEKRKRDGLPGLAIQWGPVGDVGYLAESDVQIFNQMLGQNIYSCLNTLEKFMLQESAIVSSIVLEKGGLISSAKTKSPVDVVAHILGIRDIDSVDKSTTLSQLGLDSLMTAEVKQTLNKRYQLDLGTCQIRDLTFDKLGQMGNNCEKKSI